MRALALALVIAAAVGACSDVASTEVDGRRVLLIDNTECHGDCVAPWSIVHIGRLDYAASCSSVRASSRGSLYAVRRAENPRHNWIEARAIRGFDPHVVLAARQGKHSCGGEWTVAHVVTTPTSRDEAVTLARALCTAGETPVDRSWRTKCADGGPFEWYSRDGGSIEGVARLRARR